MIARAVQQERQPSNVRLRLGGYRGAAFVFLLSRIAVLIAAAGIVLVAGSSISEVLSRWDGGWYLSIVRDGYPAEIPAGLGVAGQSSVAFFPGYPLLIRAVSEPLGLSTVFVGAAISMLAGLGAILLLWRLAARLTEVETADRTVVLFSFLPSSFVLSMVYADALFLVLVIACLLALLDEKWAAAGIAAAGAGFVRPSGVILVIVCAAAAGIAVVRDHDWGSLVAPVLAPLGVLSYFLYLRTHTGSFFAFVQVEDRGWHNRFDFGAANARAIARNLSEGRLTFFIAILGVVVLGAAVGIWLLVRWRPPAVIVTYVLCVVVLAFLVSRPTSVPRFLLLAFPLLIAVARELPERAVAPVAGASGALMVALFFVTGLSDTLSP